MADLDPSFDITAHPIIDLNAIFNREKHAIEKLHKELKAKGWSILRLPSSCAKFGDKSFIPLPVDITESVAFFVHIPEKEKERCMGYSKVPHKESIHMRSPENPLRPKSFHIKGIMNGWCALWDEASSELIDIIATDILKCSPEGLISRANLPTKRIGMMDVAFYKNQQTATLSPHVGHSTEEVNCVPHYDPGLLSVSFLSTRDGLQLKDPVSDTWFAGPVSTRPGQEDLGVLWLGDAAVKASEGELKAGVHRVVYPQAAGPRVAAWYEICTLDQINQEVLENAPLAGTAKIPNLPDSQPIKLKKGNSKKKLEKHTGVPNSKTLYNDYEYVEVEDGKNARVPKEKPVSSGKTTSSCIVL